MASADILEPFAQNNEIFDTEMEDLGEGAQDGVLDQSSLNENPKSPAKVETLFTKDDIFDDESSLQSSLDSNENSKGVEYGDSEVSRLVVDESLNISATQSGTEPALDNNDLFDDEKSPQNSGSSDNEDEENETDKRTSSQRSPKPRRLKKAAIQSIHSECQKMLRESVVRLPYHQPAAKPITDFLKRVPIVKPKDVKLTQQKVIKNSLSDASCDVISTTQPSSVSSDGKAATPKLSDATDSFFLNETPTEKRPVKGVQSLMQRFAKHTTKPQSKSKVAIKTKEADVADAEKQSTDKPPAVLLKEKIEKAMPGERLKILKQQLESKMKVQRAEMRKIYESQRRLDNEEMSEEEEEEEEMTDEESDSDYELDKWNEEDEKKQEEEDGDDDDSVEKKNDLIDDEAGEDDDSKDSFDDINSGSDGDVSDEGNSDDDEDKNSVFSDDEQIKHKKRHKVKKQKKTKENIPKIHDERTIDLFNVNSNSQTDSENCNTADKDAENTNSESTEPGLCLRLDSIEEDEEGSQDFTKTKECKSTITAKLPSTVEESSQSSFSFHMTSDPEETNESSRIQPAQGGGNNRPVSRGSESTELLTMFPKISRHINGNQKNAEPQNKKAGKLSQLTLPIEDSQDLFYDESTGDNDEEKAQEQVTVSKNFSFTLDEDTQFTQMLDTQGFLFSTSKSKSKDLLEGSKKNNTQGMEEILGLCSGKFSGLESMPKKQSEKPHSFFDDKMKNATQGMEEILGLCSGNFSGLESMPKKQSEKSRSLFGDKNKSPNMDELIGLCSGQFVSDKSTDEMSTRKMKPRSLLGTAIEGEASKSSQMDELLDLCSGAFPATEKPDTQKKTNYNTSIKLNTKDREEEGDKKESDSNNKEEEEEGEDTDVEAENEENPDDEENDDSEKDEESEGEDSDVDINIDEMRKKKKYQRSYGKIFNKKKFYEEEAELSGSDIGSDEDLDIDTDEDVLEEDSDQEQLPSDEELQKQITKVHMKSLLDQDKTELRFLQDMYLQDGDLHGEGRKRNFRWRGIDSNSQMDLFDNKLWSEDDHGNIELLTEEECKRRKERYERDTFLREEMSKMNQDSFVDMDENSQVILNFIKDTSNASPALVKPDENQQQTKPKPVIPPPRLQRIPSQKGSFLNRSKATLSRLSSITANTPNASSGRTFVFKTIDSADKIKAENSKKMPRTTSLIEPSAKRPKLDRSLSDTSNSIFAML